MRPLRLEMDPEGFYAFHRVMEKDDRKNYAQHRV